MLLALSGQTPPVEIGTSRQDLETAKAALWLDLISPTEAERAAVERATGLRLPSEADVSEVEASSRLIRQGDVLTLSTPMVNRGHNDELTVRPLGFVLAADRLITLRYAASQTFDHFQLNWHSAEPCGGLRPFIGLIEALVDRMADGLEQQGAGLEKMTGTIFGASMETRNPRARDIFLRRTLTEIGRTGERISHLRDALLGVLRIARFVRDGAAGWMQDKDLKSLATVEADVVSLNDYETQLMGKVQFLLDATLGYINIEQNNSVKLLTVVSLVGIPPTLIAGIYGMNFKNMPELDWHYGYPYGLTLILLSAILPWLWFKARGLI